MNPVDSVLSNMSTLRGTEAVQAAKIRSEQESFSSLVQQMRNEKSAAVQNVSGEQMTDGEKLNGDCISGFDKSFISPVDKTALPQGAAANNLKTSTVLEKTKTIDKTSKLYEKSLQLESYFVKMMLSSMRKTVDKAVESDYGQSMYEDMLYDEYATLMTKNAGFGLADEIYMQLA